MKAIVCVVVRINNSIWRKLTFWVPEFKSVQVQSIVAVILQFRKPINIERRIWNISKADLMQSLVKERVALNFFKSRFNESRRIFILFPKVVQVGVR